MLDKLEHNFPPIDIVFNNAGIARPGSDPWDISAQNYLDHYTVNTLAPIRICYRLIPPMIRRGFGRVVNISSTLQKSPADMAYACSKAALGQFVHDLAPSLDGTGVAISLVCPGHVRSDMGGQKAPHPVASVIPGAILGALLDTAAVNGHWIVAQDYAGLSLPEAIGRAKFYYRQEGL
jgi:NAD(P)-dependent dehydrogenase (short-subunit alcohol dehydrogenase family)